MHAEIAERLKAEKALAAIQETLPPPSVPWQPQRAEPAEPPVLDATTWTRLKSLSQTSDRRLLDELVWIYLRETPARIDKLRQAAVDADWLQIHKAAHALKKTSASIGAHRLLQLVQGFDFLTSSEESLQALVEPLEREFGRVRTALEDQLAGTNDQKTLERV